MHRTSSALVALAGLLACGTPEEPPPEPTPAPVATPAPTPTPTPEPVTPDPGAALGRAILGEVVDREAADPANAWALAHGILARGPDFTASDGRRAIDVLATDYLRDDLSFPKSIGDRRVEPHTDLILKTLVEAGVPLDAPLADGKPTLRALLEASQARFDRSLPEPNDAPWSVQAYCQSGASWDGLEEVTSALLSKLEAETHFLRQAIVAGTSVEKRKQDIFAYTCGGAHLFGGAAACAAAGWPKEGNTKLRFDDLFDRYLFRVPLETDLVDASLKQYPQLAPLLHNQDVKFLGHLLEVTAKAQRDGLWEPAEAEATVLDNVEARLLADVIILKQSGVYEPAAMETLAKDPSTFQLYLDLVGDASHAANALRIRDAL